MKEIDQTKLAFLINDCFAGIEKSTVGDIYLRDASGEIKRTPEGCPYVNMPAMSVLTTVLQTAIIRGALDA